MMRFIAPFVFMFSTAMLFCLPAAGQTPIAWLDFSDVPNPNGGSADPVVVNNSAGGGRLTANVTLNAWDTNNDLGNDFADGMTDDGAFTWDSDAAVSLIGFGATEYSATFGNISTADGSLYLAAGALEDDSTLQVQAFNSANQLISLASTGIVGQWDGRGSSGTPTWAANEEGNVWLLSTPGGGASGVNAIVDLSNLGIARLQFDYTDADGGSVRAGDRWHVNLAGNSTAAIPEPTSTFALGGLLIGAIAMRRKRSSNPKIPAGPRR